MELSVLIVSYNTSQLTAGCLRSVHAQTQRIEFEVVVVDNQSTDGLSEAIAEQFPRAILIRASKNLGFAGGNNEAAKQATGHWLLLLNPDTVVLEGAIQKLLGFAEAHREADIFGGRTLFADGSLNPASCWRRPTPWSLFCIATGLTSLLSQSNLFARESYGSWSRDTIREVDIVSGCFFLIRRSVWDEFGGFDPAFFMYGEEADLCLRVKKFGHKCMVCPDATIVHYGGASEKVRADKMVKLFRAKAQLFGRHWNPRSRWFGTFCLDLWACTRMTAFFFLQRLQRRRAESYQTWRAIWRQRNQWHGVRMADAPQHRSSPELATNLH